MPGRDFGNVLVVADATVDQQGFSACSKDEALNGKPVEIPGAIEKVGLQRAAMPLKQFRIGSRQELRQWKGKIVVIDDDVDGRVTDRKTHESSCAGVPRQLRISALPAKAGHGVP